MDNTTSPQVLLAALIDRLRPPKPGDAAAAQQRIQAETARLASDPAAAQALGQAIESCLALPYQGGFYAETGVRSALGFWLELGQRISQRLLPRVADAQRLADLLRCVLRQPDDGQWMAAIPAADWLALLATLPPFGEETRRALDANLHQAMRMLSYRLAGAALDRELLRAEPALERYESPFLAQNAALLPILERVRNGGPGPDADEVGDLDVLLDQCTATLERIRRKAGESGVSVRLTYLLARLRQLIERLRLLLDLYDRDEVPLRAVGLMQTLIAGEQQRRHLRAFIGENISLLARNVTDHASRHGEHYISEDRAAWLAMARSAAGGGVIIAGMAMLKVQIALLHLPPLTEGVAFGLNYALGFVLIHLLGFTVATKQPAMTAAAIAATLEESRPRDLERLGDLAQNVVRTQFVAVLGNVCLALPVACLIAWLWPQLFGGAMAPLSKAEHMLHEVHPWHSGALWFAAVAGVGLFLSGLVSGYFDNQARYHQLAGRVAALPAVQAWGAARAQRFGEYLDTHYGAILGNLFFGMYLGLVGALGGLTGLPVDIRHVAFSSANLGTAATLLPWAESVVLLPWAVLGVVLIALVNLAVSFALALYVAMKSRRLGAAQIASLGLLLGRRFLRNPFSFLMPPRQADV